MQAGICVCVEFGLEKPSLTTGSVMAGRLPGVLNPGSIIRSSAPICHDLIVAPDRSGESTKREFTVSVNEFDIYGQVFSHC